MFHICVVANITHSESFAVVHLPHSFVALETKFAGYILRAVCSYLTLFTLFAFGFFGAVDSE